MGYLEISRVFLGHSIQRFLRHIRGVPGRPREYFRESQGRFRGSQEIQGGFRDVSRTFQGILKDLMGVSGRLKGLERFQRVLGGLCCIPCYSPIRP